MQQSVVQISKRSMTCRAARAARRKASVQDGSVAIKKIPHAELRVPRGARPAFRMAALRSRKFPWVFHPANSQWLQLQEIAIAAAAELPVGSQARVQAVGSAADVPVRFQQQVPYQTI